MSEIVSLHAARQAPLEVLTLSLGGETFALEAAIVHEILDTIAITEVPGAPDFAPGIVNVRGKVVPLVDLRPRFGMPITPATIDTRIIAVELMLEGGPLTVGILADKVFEVTELAAASIENAPRIGMRWQQAFVRCVGKRRADFIIVPDLARILLGERASPTPAGADGVQPVHS